MSKSDRSAERAANITTDAQSSENNINRNQKFKMFFAGLIFAILSFVGTSPISTGNIYIKIFETLSSLSLLLSGIFLLSDLAVSAGIMPNGFYIRRLCIYMHNNRFDYWTLFLIGISLMVIDRSVFSFIK
jgi:hypothetical protein